MILKIRSWNHEINGLKLPSWVHLNNIAIIDVQPEKWDNFIKNCDNGLYNRIWLRNEKGLLPYVYLASITLQNGEAKAYVFEEGFLLNGEGKTIEKYTIR